jgi:hypothetical protein
MSTRAEEPGVGNETATPPGQEPAPGGLGVSHQEMDNARARGEARPFAGGVTWIARYKDAWWIAYEGGWLRVVDEPLQADLDRNSARLEATESAAARHRVLIRSLRIIAAPDEIGEQA